MKQTFVPPGDGWGEAEIERPPHYAPPPHVQHIHHTSNELDRARAFNKVTIPLACMFGAAIAGLLAITTIPLFSVAALATFFVASATAWTVAYTVHQFISPWGHLWLQAVLTYRYLRHEQQARLNRIQETNPCIYLPPPRPPSMTRSTPSADPPLRCLPAPNDTHRPD